MAIQLLDDYGIRFLFWWRTNNSL